MLSNDKCVNCNVLTKFNVLDDINLRQYYIEGAGRLCKKCWRKVYVKKETQEQEKEVE